MKNKINNRLIRLRYKKLDGIGVVEIILILVILVGLVLIFKGQITDIINKAFKAITSDSNNIIK